MPTLHDPRTGWHLRDDDRGDTVTYADGARVMVTLPRKWLDLTPEQATRLAHHLYEAADEARANHRDDDPLVEVLMGCAHAVVPLPDGSEGCERVRLTHYLPCAVCEQDLAEEVAR